YFLLKGRCRECGAKIPAVFPVTELAMGFLSATVIGLFSFSLHGILWIGFFGCLLVTVQTDYRSGFVYNEALYPLLSFALALTFVEADIVLRFARAIMWLGMILVLAWGVKKVLQKEAMGEGDYYVIFALALVAQYQEMLEVILGASLLGIIVAWKWKQVSLPFIPLLGTAFSLVFFLRVFA
ncbi:MAG: prepilin peptidase, partial [Candidatus Margulisiibacteriota bacterium]